jgi:hypothetical protein
MSDVLAPLSARSEAITRRTYNRPLDDEGSKFETWKQTIQRSHFDHHVKLWEGAGGKVDYSELDELVALGLDRSGLVSGRTLWLGGTEYGTSRASSNFNCSALNLETVYDMVDAMWLLLNGCGVGGKAKAGTLHGYYRRIPKLTVVPSEREKTYRGHRENRESLPTADNNWTWTIVVGDSAEAWAKAPGKMLVSPRGRVDELVLDFSNIRGAGGRLKGYGWICNGYKPFAAALSALHTILNRNAANLLNEEDILDIFNWFGTVLSSRRAAEAGLMDQYHPLVEQFATRKRNYWEGNIQRGQSNNSILFWSRPDIDDIADLLYMNLDGGEPGFVNASAALSKCSWFNAFNPCLTGDTLVSTEDGYVPIKLLAEKGSAKVFDGNGKCVSAKCRKTADDAPVVTVTLSSGEVIRCTPNHQFVLRDGARVEAAALTAGTVLMPSAPYKFGPDRDFGYNRVEKPGGPSVVSVEDKGEREDVYCFGVPTTHSFDLVTVHTGNCFEICLPSHGFCNLVSICLPSFGRDFYRLERAVWVMARANYRQTCVNLHDEILQKRWNQTNESLRLCGVSFTGVAQAGWLTDYQIRRLRNSATLGAYSMADELQMPRPKAVTTIKPEGTRSKISGRLGMEIAEGMHLPLGQYIFNWINFSPSDPLVGALEAAGYRTMPNPNDSNNVLVRFPVEYANCGFSQVKGKAVNTESAIDQLERYRRWNVNWADHNVSATISLSRSEVPEVAQWVHDNWDDGYLATAFLQRVDPTKSAKDVGQPYLPQEVVEQEVFAEAMSNVKPVDWDRFHTGWHEISDVAECAGGVCPTK